MTDGAAEPGAHGARGTPRNHGRGNGSQPRPGAERALFGALDLGTNNCRLLVATPTGDTFRVVTDRLGSLTLTCAR